MGPVSHISIGVADLDASLRFYCGLLGFEVRYDRAMHFGVAGGPAVPRRIAFVQFEAGPGANFYLALNEQRDRPLATSPSVLGAGLNHFSFYVRDIEAVHARMVAAGVPVRSDLKIDPVDPWSVDGERRVMTVMYEDPDGVIVQLEEELPIDAAPAALDGERFS